jgi:tetrahydrodipicolinate N-succinyltransferase
MMRKQGEIDMTKFDFKDGKGPVPAKKHSNGGGWVADTATVAETAFVGPDALVFGNARVSGNARVYGNAWVYGYAQVSGDAKSLW